ncbi:Hypothetical protein BRZCDTV_397 [Brazilian cedratvirus IHUMI]|uniref:Uncharacterized protein n=1 Tax=Brazilian cedratvirus IHUMI TaxID=2126980 RepID=A0A2R8FEZ6_9VIRU|nr:Hypothetical protein BRZCDTV_397 [Brazilian cedratvirus IHUMI]
MCVQLSDYVFITILEYTSPSFLKRVNGFCKLARIAFLQRGAYFDLNQQQTYFNYLLQKDNYKLFIFFLDKEDLCIKDGILTTRQGEKIRFCHKSDNKVATCLQRRGVFIDCSCVTECYLP